MWWTVIAVIIAATMGYGVGVKEGASNRARNYEFERTRNVTPSAPPIDIL